jgi:large subunit ribosomal protein L19
MISLFEIEKGLMKEKVTDFRPGDTVDVHLKLTEADRERVQIFNGLVIARKHSGPRETFTVRRIVQGEGVERIFPLHLPNLVKIVVKKRGHTRRAKLYYLRTRIGRATKLKKETKVLVVPGAEEMIPETKASPEKTSQQLPETKTATKPQTQAT